MTGDKDRFFRSRKFSGRKSDCSILVFLFEGKQKIGEAEAGGIVDAVFFGATLQR